jgi:hypothetical protein
LVEQQCLASCQLGGLTAAKTSLVVIFVEQQCLASRQLGGLTAAKTGSESYWWNSSVSLADSLVTAAKTSYRVVLVTAVNR